MNPNRLNEHNGLLPKLFQTFAQSLGVLLQLKNVGHCIAFIYFQIITSLSHLCTYLVLQSLMYVPLNFLDVK